METGQVPTSAVAGLKGASGEVPGAHANRQGAAWESFKADIAANGIRNPVFVTVDHGSEPKISEGSHRRDAAVELGLPTVPVEIRYFGHAERQGTVTGRASRLKPDPAGVAGPLPSKRTTMAGVPASDPLWAKLNKRLTTPQTATRTTAAHAKGEVRRPAVPGYKESVAKVADAITAEIGKQGTLPAGRAWYPEEHKRAVARAAQYGVTVQQAAGVVSATSPRTSYMINQRVTDQILAGAETSPEALRHAGGGVMGTFRDDGVSIALGGNIGKELTGTKRRAFYNNIMWPGKTGDVTVDTWMFDSMTQGLGLTPEQAHYLGGELTKDFPDHVGVLLVSDATRMAAAKMGETPDAVQAAYWIARQQSIGIVNPSSHEGATPRGGVHFAERR